MSKEIPLPDRANSPNSTLKTQTSNLPPFVKVYTQEPQGQAWIDRYRGKQPVFACVLGFTETGLLPGISAAGATPADRRYTAIADAEFLVNGPQPHPRYPLPPLHVGASPTLISRAVVEALNLPVYVLNAGLPTPPAVPAIDLGGVPARCLSQGKALDRAIVEHLFQQGLHWGENLAASSSYLILGECVVGGTTTALAVLTGLGIDAAGKVNSSHATCNHAQKWQLVQMGLTNSKLKMTPSESLREQNSNFKTQNSKLKVQDFCPSPIDLVAAVGDPMQIVVAGMAIAASRSGGVLLAGGTQMLAVYALVRTIAQQQQLHWQPEQIVVGTTRWVAADRTGDTIGLAQIIGDVPLLATQLSFASSKFAQLRVYEQGFVKEGVGAGGCAIAAHLYQNWQPVDLLPAIEALAERYAALNPSGIQPSAPA